MNIKHSLFPALFIIVSLYMFTGCGRQYIKPVDENICTKCVNFIENGKTKKEEVLQKSDFYELFKTYKSKNDTILIFRFSSSQNNTYATYHLVLIFDENGVLKKHSLVRTS